VIGNRKIIEDIYFLVGVVHQDHDDEKNPSGFFVVRGTPDRGSAGENINRTGKGSRRG
jgi:hypothetical protein